MLLDDKFFTMVALVVRLNTLILKGVGKYFSQSNTYIRQINDIVILLATLL